MPLEPAGMYQVWHNSQEGYDHVANVECANRFSAMVATLAWQNKAPELERMVTPLVEGARGFAFGDVIVNPEGKAYELHNDKHVGPTFKEVEFSQAKPSTWHAIFAVKTHDNVRPPDLSASKDGQALQDILSGAGETGKKDDHLLKATPEWVSSDRQDKEEHER